MTTNFPTSLDSFTDPGPSSQMTNPSHSALHTNINSAVEALQAKVGVDDSAVSSSIDYRVGTLEDTQIPNTLINAKGDLIVGSAADTASILPVGTNGYVLTANSLAANGVVWAEATGGGGGTGPFDSDQNILAVAVFS